MRRRLAVLFAALALLSCEDEFPDGVEPDGVDGEWTIAGPTNPVSATTSGCSGTFPDEEESYALFVGVCEIDPITASQSGRRVTFGGGSRFSCTLPGGTTVEGDVSGSATVDGDRLTGTVVLTGDDPGQFEQAFDFEGTVEGTEFTITETERADLDGGNRVGSCDWSPEPHYHLSIDR